jgi:hypothetical protein
LGESEKVGGAEVAARSGFVETSCCGTGEDVEVGVFVRVELGCVRAVVIVELVE